MKKLLLVCLLFVATAVSAQNLQLHYDFGRQLYSELDKSELSDGRATLTTTFEMFRPDKVGSTYLFVDMDYNRGVSIAPGRIPRTSSWPSRSSGTTSTATPPRVVAS